MQRLSGRRSTVPASDAPTLIQAARDELAQDDPAAFLVVVLGLCVGLRKGEIDLLPWSAVDLRHGVIRIEPTKYFAPKTDVSPHIRPDRIGKGSRIVRIPLTYEHCGARQAAPLVIAELQQSRHLRARQILLSARRTQANFFRCGSFRVPDLPALSLADLFGKSKILRKRRSRAAAGRLFAWEDPQIRGAAPQSFRSHSTFAQRTKFAQLLAPLSLGMQRQVRWSGPPV